MGGPRRPPDPFAPFRAEARNRHGYCTAFRLGVVVGESGVELPCPYVPGNRADRYQEGVAWGHAARAPDEQKREPHDDTQRQSL